MAASQCRVDAILAVQRTINASDACPSDANPPSGVNPHKKTPITPDTSALRSHIGRVTSGQKTPLAPEHGNAAIAAAANRIFIDAAGRRE
jgi:hypothetical protein